jgi:hypothetical protein
MVWGAENCDQVPQILDDGRSFRRRVCSMPHYMLFLGPHPKSTRSNSETASTFWCSFRVKSIPNSVLSRQLQVSGLLRLWSTYKIGQLLY